MTDQRSADRPDFDRLGELLPAGGAPPAGPVGEVGSTPTGALAAGGPAGDLSQRLAVVWADVVGDEVAENARPVQLRDGRLVVTTSSSAWAQTLQLMSPMVVAGLNERLGEGSVERAVFRHAGWDIFAGLDGRKTAGAAGPGAPAKGRQGRGERKPARRDAPGTAARETAGSSAAPESLAGGPPASPAGEAPEEPPSSDRGRERAAPPAAAVPAPAPVPTQKPAGLEGFSEEEKQALADLEGLPLAPSVKQTIREAMMAGFARARQDSGRS